MSSDHKSILERLKELEYIVPRVPFDSLTAVENAKGAVVCTVNLMSELALIKHDLTLLQEEYVQMINTIFSIKKKINEVIECLNKK